MANVRFLAPRRFDFARDSFAFANELLWEYRPDPARGTMTFARRQPRPLYAHRCFVLTRAARQFLYHARFDSALAPADDDTYRRQICQTMARNPRQACEPARQIVFPGFASLREFSRDRESVLKACCGGAWQSYFLRSHWRMVLPISREHQFLTATGLAEAIAQGHSPLVHLVRFPALTINHGMILFAVRAEPQGWEFMAYDPNDPLQPTTLRFDRARGTFSLPPNNYWAGGPLEIIEIFRSWWF